MRTEGEEAARSALHYVAPVGEKEEYVSQAMNTSLHIFLATRKRAQPSFADRLRGR
jgi:hypothetical protein